MIMDTAFVKGLSRAETRRIVGKFYDLGSPYYLQVWGEHIHDGYFVTGKETRQEAQINLVDLLASQSDIQRGQCVLDVGCGVGGSSVRLARVFGAETFGITISRRQAMIAKGRAAQEGASSSFALMDAEQMGFPRGRGIFDVVWAVAVMTHLHDQKAFAKAAIELLNDGGRFVIFDWMLGENANEIGDSLVTAVSEGMLLSSLHRMSEYTGWLEHLGLQTTYSENMTQRTIKTWELAMSTLTDPDVWKIAIKTSAEERRELLRFLKAIVPMKRSMEQGKLISGAIVARKP